MNVMLSPHSTELIQQMVDSGRYQTADEVLEEALLALDDQLRLERLRAAIDIGDEQLERGEYELLTPELIEEMNQSAREKWRNGHQPDPDVCP